MRNLKLQRVECQIHPGYKAETWASKKTKIKEGKTEVIIELLVWGIKGSK